MKIWPWSVEILILNGPKGSGAKEIAVTGNKFNQDIINSINQMNDGGELLIDNIKVKFSDGSVRNLSPIEIKLKAKKTN